MKVLIGRNALLRAFLFNSILLLCNNILWYCAQYVAGALASTHSSIRYHETLKHTACAHNSLLRTNALCSTCYAAAYNSK